MNRRELLGSLGSVCLAGAAGCIAGSETGAPDGDADGDGSTESATTTPDGEEMSTASATVTPTPADSSETDAGSTLSVPEGSESGRWRDVQYGGDHAPPAPPSELSAGVVRDVAAEAEEAYLYDRLENASDLRSYGVAGYTVDPGAYLADRGADAVLVRVRMGYSYECESMIADAVSRATYRIATDEVLRVEGTTVDPSC